MDHEVVENIPAASPSSLFRHLSRNLSIPPKSAVSSYHLVLIRCSPPTPAAPAFVSQYDAIIPPPR